MSLLDILPRTLQDALPRHGLRPWREQQRQPIAIARIEHQDDNLILCKANPVFWEELNLEPQKDIPLQELIESSAYTLGLHQHVLDHKENRPAHVTLRKRTDNDWEDAYFATTIDRNYPLVDAYFINNEETVRQARTDALTGLANRTQLKEQAYNELVRMTRHSGTLSIINMDVDKFKPINDTYGHSTGDLVLVTLANALQQGARTTDTFCRYGGDEFVGLLPQTTHEQAQDLTDRIRQEITTYVQPILDGATPLNGKEPLTNPFSISIGTAQISALRPDANIKEIYQQLLRRADESMYASGKQ